MKSIIYLSVSIVFIFTCAFSCGGYCHTFPPSVEFKAYANDSTLLFDSVVNATEGETVWINPRTPWQQDSIEGRLDINPEKTKTTFHFYSVQKVDTLDVEYEFDYVYNRCDEYIFEMQYGRVVRSSFTDMESESLGIKIRLD